MYFLCPRTCSARDYHSSLRLVLKMKNWAATRYMAAGSWPLNSQMTGEFIREGSWSFSVGCN